jgi:hypothetical protein
MTQTNQEPIANTPSNLKIEGVRLTLLCPYGHSS